MSAIKLRVPSPGARLLPVLLWVLLVSLPAISQASFEKALVIYTSGEFSDAKRAFEALASIGDRPSLFNLGVMYYRGEGVASDPIKAYVLMKIANDGFDDENFTRISSLIYSKFDDSQKDEAENLAQKLEPVYGIDVIKRNIFPRLLDDDDCPPEVTPIKNAVARYPRSEQRKGKMGLTYLEYTISPEGYPRDMVVTGSTSKSFTQETVRSMKRALYAPTINGKPVYGHRMVFTYHLDLATGNKINIRPIVKELSELEDEAKKGDVVAQYSYAYRLNVFRFFKTYLEKQDLQYRTANEWFAKSAAGGLPNAQFEVGRNMIEGRGCEIDTVNGYKWVSAAAIGGHPAAQKMLAQSALTEHSVSDQKSLAAVGWLRNAVLSKSEEAKVLLAWELSTSSVEQLRDGNEALELLDDKPREYFDEVRILETKAAAHAEIGNFDRAIKYQKKAVNKAEKLEWEIPLLLDRLGLYEHGEPYRGSYY